MIFSGTLWMLSPRKTYASRQASDAHTFTSNMKSKLFQTRRSQHTNPHISTHTSKSVSHFDVWQHDIATHQSNIVQSFVYSSGLHRLTMQNHWTTSFQPLQLSPSDDRCPSPRMSKKASPKICSEYKSYIMQEYEWKRREHCHAIIAWAVPVDAFIRLRQPTMSQKLLYAITALSNAL